MFSRQSAAATAAGYTFEWAGEYQSRKRSEARLLITVPLTVFLIFFLDHLGRLSFG